MSEYGAVLFPNTPLDEWKRRYGLEHVQDSACRKCGKLVAFAVPFANQHIRGLTTDHLECGEEFRQWTWNTNDPEFDAAVGEILSTFKGPAHE
jgi:hypothetical protein